MKNYIILIFLFYASTAGAVSVIKNVAVDDEQNIIITLDRKADFKTYSLTSPNRLVIDIEDAIIDNDAFAENFPSFISAIRKGAKDNNFRIVFDLEKKIYIKKTSFQKTKKDEFGKIIVAVSFDEKFAQVNKVEIKSAENESEKNVHQAPQAPQDLQPWAKMITNVPAKDNKPETKYVVNDHEKIEKVPVVVIDAGHGGKDPGTIGDYARTKEKNITLSYARELAKHLINTKNYRVYLTRSDDEFIPLKGRVEKARSLKADLFISLHADSASDRSTSGLSVYTLSEKSSDKQAELLAQKENRSDIIAGINFADTSGDILKTLIDLSQRSTMNSSSKFASNIIKSMQKHDITTLQNTHRFAGFMVLTAPDMTSVLIELGYLSNPNEEADLNSLGHKRNIVKALVDAIDEYFKIKPRN